MQPSPSPAPTAHPETAFRALWPTDLDNLLPAQPWLWTGFLAPGQVTLLTSPPKAGKTTLTAALLSRLGAGGTLAGQAVAPGKAVVVSEECPQQWHDRRGSWN